MVLPIDELSRVFLDEAERLIKAMNRREHDPVKIAEAAGGFLLPVRSLMEAGNALRADAEGSGTWIEGELEGKRSLDFWESLFVCSKVCEHLISGHEPSDEELDKMNKFFVHLHIPILKKGISDLAERLDRKAAG